MSPYTMPGLPTVDQIIAECWHTQEENLHRISRERECVEPRQVAIYYKVKHLGISPTAVSRQYPGRNGTLDHSTVHHCLHIVDNYLKTDKVFRIKFERAIKKCDEIFKIEDNE